MPSYRSLKNYLRQQEKQNQVKPVKMHKIDPKDETKGLKISFDKQVLYHNDTPQTDHFFKASSQLNTEVHSELLKRYLESHFPGVTVEVKVVPKYATIAKIPLKIPFTNLGIRRDPKKVRGDQNDFLATVNTKVKLKMTGNVHSIEGEALWQALNKAACLHSENKYANENNDINLIADDVAGRKSKNLFRIAKSQTKPYGYVNANYLIDQPIFHNGATATAANAVGPIAAVAAVAALVVCEAKLNSSNSHQSNMGFLAGAVEPNSLTNAFLVTDMLTSSGNNVGDFAIGYGQGLMFNRTANAIVATARMTTESSKHMPFATRSVIKPK